MRACVRAQVGKLNNEELAKVFDEWNGGELESFLIEITAKIFTKKDDDGTTYVVDNILDKTGSKGTGMWTCQEAAAQGVAADTIAAALNARCVLPCLAVPCCRAVWRCRLICTSPHHLTPRPRPRIRRLRATRRCCYPSHGRYMSSQKDDRVAASKVLSGPTDMPEVDRSQLIDDVRQALYAAKICSYAQGLNLIRAAAKSNEWTINLGECARIWRGGCIIRAKFLDRCVACCGPRAVWLARRRASAVPHPRGPHVLRCVVRSITEAFGRNPDLASLLVDPEFADEVNSRQLSWRRVVTLSAAVGIPIPAFSGSLNYMDAYRRARLPANLTQVRPAHAPLHPSCTARRCRATPHAPVPVLPCSPVRGFVPAHDLQAQRDFFGAHTYMRLDGSGPVHTEWVKGV